MNTKKIFSFLLSLIAIAGLLTHSSCEDLLSVEDKAEKAASEMCECIKNKSANECKEQLNNDYGYYADNDDFIKAFNNSQTCGVTIFKEKK